MGKPFFVTDGATLKCSFGAMTSTLKVMPSHGGVIEGKNQALITDFVVGKNIFPFQMCKKMNPPIPCTPVVCMPWVKGKRDFMTQNQMALMDDCMVPCMLGGIIEIDRK